MNRNSFRLICVVAVLVALCSTIPSAEARTLNGSRTTANHTDIYSAAIAWLTQLGILPSSQTGLNHRASATSTTDGTMSGGLSRPNTGACIDPLGSPHCSM
jgi:hypothetical protein